MQTFSSSLLALLLASPVVLNALPLQSPGIVSHSFSNLDYSETLAPLMSTSNKRFNPSGNKIQVHAPPRDFRAIQHYKVSESHPNSKEKRQDTPGNKPNMFKAITEGMWGAARHRIPKDLPNDQ